MKKKPLPEDHKRVNEIVSSFNRTVKKVLHSYYVARYRKTYLYLDQFDYKQIKKYNE